MFGKKKIVFYVVLIVALASLLAACGGAAATEAPAAEAPVADATEVPAAAEAPAADATEVPAAETPAAAAPASGDVVPQFVFTNTGAVEICELYLSPVGVDSWGPDQLGGMTIAVSEKFTLKNIPAASYDVKVVGCKGSGESVVQLDIKN